MLEQNKTYGKGGGAKARRGQVRNGGGLPGVSLTNNFLLGSKCEGRRDGHGLSAVNTMPLLLSALLWP